MIIRTYIYLLLLTLSVLFFGAIIIVLSYFTKPSFLSLLSNSWAKTNLFFLKYICGLTYQLIDWTKLPDDQPYILLSKHQSAWETISLRALLPPNQVWAIKKELTTYPFLGASLIKTGQIPLDRKNGRKAVKELLSKGKQALQNNNVVIIFPEGTRSNRNDLPKYHIGGAKLAEHSHHKIYTIAHNAGLFWPKGFLIKPGVVKIKVCDEIDPVGLGSKDINKLVINSIESNMKLLDG